MFPITQQMNPFAIAWQLVARTFLWIFIFSAEVIAPEIAKILPRSNFFSIYAFLFGLAVAIFLTVVLLKRNATKSEAAMLADMLDLCFYDVVMLGLNLVLYLLKYPAILLHEWLFAIFLLKFGRLLWPAKSNNGGDFSVWPVFGIFGWREKNFNSERVSNKPNPKQAMWGYIFILGCLIFAFVRPQIGLTVHLWHIGLISFLCAPMLYLRVRANQIKQQKKYDSATHEALLERLEKQKAITSAEVQERSNELLKAKNIELAKINSQLEQANTQLATSNTQLALAKATAEQSEKEKQAALEQVNRLNAALCDASHDLRRPMAGVNRRVAELVQAIDKPEEVRETAVTELNNAMRFLYKSLDSTIHDGMLATGLAQPEIRAVAVLQMFDELFADWMQEAMRKGFDYIRCYPKGVFPPPVATDKALLWRILHNLVINGITHGGQGTKLVMSVRAHGQLATIRVWDTGPGIEGLEGRDMAANFLNLLARPRQKKHERTSDGHGLGLHIVWKLTQILGVTIGVRSRLGVGTLFRFDLPLADEALIVASKQADQHEAALLAKVGMNAQSNFRGSVLWPNLLD